MKDEETFSTFFSPLRQLSLFPSRRRYEIGNFSWFSITSRAENFIRLSNISSLLSWCTRVRLPRGVAHQKETKINGFLCGGCRKLWMANRKRLTSKSVSNSFVCAARKLQLVMDDNRKCSSRKIVCVCVCCAAPNIFCRNHVFAMPRSNTIQSVSAYEMWVSHNEQL